jgi:hypothetical protein
MNDKQRENTAKYLYDPSKIVFTFTVVAKAVSEKFRANVFWLELLAAALLFSLAYVLNSEGEK